MRYILQACNTGCLTDEHSFPHLSSHSEGKRRHVGDVIIRSDIGGPVVVNLFYLNAGDRRTALQSCLSNFFDYLEFSSEVIEIGIPLSMEQEFPELFSWFKNLLIDNGLNVSYFQYQSENN